MFKVLGVDHIGIAVRDLPGALNFWENALGLTEAGREQLPDQKVTTSFLPIQETGIELLEAFGEDSPVSEFIKKRGEGVQHIALLVDDLEAAERELVGAGASLIGEKSTVGAHGKRVRFIHPGSTGGVLLELCEVRRMSKT
jgi:methylmalonyl-CoA epimerase